jgi:hypothetical protein
MVIKLDDNRYVVMSMLNRAHTGGDNFVLTTPTGDRVNCVLDSTKITALEGALTSGDLRVDLS